MWLEPMEEMEGVADCSLPNRFVRKLSGECDSWKAETIASQALVPQPGEVIEVLFTPGSCIDVGEFPKLDGSMRADSFILKVSLYTLQMRAVAGCPSSPHKQQRGATEQSRAGCPTSPHLPHTWGLCLWGQEGLRCVASSMQW